MTWVIPHRFESVHAGFLRRVTQGLCAAVSIWEVV